MLEPRANTTIGDHQVSFLWLLEPLCGTDPEPSCSARPIDRLQSAADIPRDGSRASRRPWLPFVFLENSVRYAALICLKNRILSAQGLEQRGRRPGKTEQQVFPGSSGDRRDRTASGEPPQRRLPARAGRTKLVLPAHIDLAQEFNVELGHIGNPTNPFHVSASHL